MSLRQKAEATGTLVRETHGEGFTLQLWRLPDESGVFVSYSPDGTVRSNPLDPEVLEAEKQRWDGIDAEMARYEEVMR